MASVKWLSKIKVIDDAYKGPFQTDDYVYYPHEDHDRDKFPVTTLNVNSIIQKPIHLSILNTGVHEIKGIAWTGHGRITELQLSFDKGKTWKNATIHSISKPRLCLVKLVLYLESRGKRGIHHLFKGKGFIWPHSTPNSILESKRLWI